MSNTNNTTVTSNLVNVHALSLFRIGDVVVMNMDEEVRSWGRKGVPNGTKGTVVGFYERWTSKNYNNGYSVPGLYRGNGAPIVKWETGECSYDSNDLVLPADIVELRREDKVYREAFDTEAKIHELPEFDYMVGNVVLVNMSDKPGLVVSAKGTITDIDFIVITDHRSGELLPVTEYKDKWVISINLDKGGSVKHPVTSIIEILKKGNYWAWLNDKSKLEFKDLKEEVSFYSSLGKRKQIVNPKTNKYSWTIEEGLLAIEKEEIDGLIIGPSLFGSPAYLNAYKLDEDLKDLASRTRAETLKGFASYKPE